MIILLVGLIIYMLVGFSFSKSRSDATMTYQRRRKISKKRTTVLLFDAKRVMVLTVTHGRSATNVVNNGLVSLESFEVEEAVLNIHAE